MFLPFSLCFWFWIFYLSYLNNLVFFLPWPLHSKFPSKWIIFFNPIILILPRIYHYYIVIAKYYKSDEVNKPFNGKYLNHILFSSACKAVRSISKIPMFHNISTLSQNCWLKSVLSAPTLQWASLTHHLWISWILPALPWVECRASHREQ